MYKKELEAKLKDIFGVKSIIFDSFKLGKEQSVIFVDVFNEKIKYSTYKHYKYCRVIGKLEICGNKEQFFSGWFHEKFCLADETQKKGLSISSKENTISFAFNQKMFEKLSLDFEYIFCYNDFNKERRKINNINYTTEIKTNG